MRQEQPNQAVRLAATNAMRNALEFVKANFENEQERNYIMQTVCETTQAGDFDLKVAAFEVIVAVAELYYQKLPAYMQALFGLTTAAITTATAQHDEDNDRLGQQAIEFWSTVCDEELELIETAREEQQARPATADDSSCSLLTTLAAYFCFVAADSAHR